MKSKMKLFVKNVNGLKPLIFVAKISNFDFVVGLDYFEMVEHCSLVFRVSLKVNILFFFSYFRIFFYIICLIISTSFNSLKFSFIAFRWFLLRVLLST